MGIGWVEHIEDVPPEDELSRSPDDVGPLVSSMDEPIEKILPAVLLPRGDADVPAALVDGTEKGSPARCQNTPFFPPPGEGFAPLDGKGPVLDAVGRQGNLVQQKYPLSREKGLPVGAEQGRLFRVGKDDQGGGGGVSADPAPCRSVEGKVKGGASRPEAFVEIPDSVSRRGGSVSHSILHPAKKAAGIPPPRQTVALIAFIAFSAPSVHQSSTASAALSRRSGRPDRSFPEKDPRTQDTMFSPGAAPTPIRSLQTSRVPAVPRTDSIPLWPPAEPFFRSLSFP
ncbi:hypothetical protein SDC9_69940 [bioreactor metagenome]|uniref:Uncharacterized protein n=1 Tax=bioreactor metagenome TaxID=1076179 RepID=A0A644Y5J8_9ZZZZ